MITIIVAHSGVALLSLSQDGLRLWLCDFAWPFGSQRFDVKQACRWRIAGLLGVIRKGCSACETFTWEKQHLEEAEGFQQRGSQSMGAELIYISSCGMSVGNAFPKTQSR